MAKQTRKTSAARLLYWAAVSASISTPFQAPAAVPYECNLSGAASSNLAGCSGSSVGGYLTSTAAVTGNGICNASDFCGVSSDTSTSVAPVYAWNICRWIDNTSVRKVFVPFRTANEWSYFLAAAPNLLGGAVSLKTCAVPYSVNSAPATTTVTPPFSGCTSITVNNPNVYGRTNVSLYPNPAMAGPTFTCHTGATSMMSLLQWRAGNVEATGSGTLSWSQNFKYSPDITLTASAAVVTEGDPVTLTWSISPYVSGDTLSCSVSPGGWGPNSAGNARSGSTTIALASSTTFTLTCTDSSSLTSVATTSVTATPPPCCSSTGSSDGSSDGGSSG